MPVSYAHWNCRRYRTRGCLSSGVRLNMEYEERGFSKDVLHREAILENVVSHNNDLTDMRSSESLRVFNCS